MEGLVGRSTVCLDSAPKQKLLGLCVMNYSVTLALILLALVCLGMHASVQGSVLQVLLHLFLSESMTSFPSRS